MKTNYFLIPARLISTICDIRWRIYLIEFTKFGLRGSDISQLANLITLSEFDIGLLQDIKKGTVKSLILLQLNQLHSSAPKGFRTPVIPTKSGCPRSYI